METIKSIAESLGLSKTGISNRIKDLGLYDQLIREGNKWIVPGEVADAVRESFQTPNEEPTDTINTELIAMLRAQLEEKDRQIKELQDTNKELIRTIQQTNHLLLTTTTTTENNTVPADAVTAEEVTLNQDRAGSAQPQERKGLFSRLFGK